jgi:hypothetical protein
VSTTDPDSTYATKGGTPARLGYYDNYLVDNHSCVIVGVQATAARLSQETVAAQDMITRFTKQHAGEPASIAAEKDKGLKPSSGDCVNRLAQLLCLRWKRRSTIRWQHRPKRERPTGTERTNRSTKSADGRMATVVTRRRKTLSNEKQNEPT